MEHVTPQNKKAILRDFLPAFALLFLSTCGILFANFKPSGEHGEYAIMAPFWYSLAQTVELVSRTGGDIVDVGGMANVMIVHSTNPAFVTAAYHAGAMLVLDPVLLRGCLADLGQKGAGA